MRSQQTGMSAKADTVTVVMPAFNRGKTIARSLRSIQAQSSAPAEVIVVDDASTDDTVEIARSFGVTVVTNATNAGSGPCRNQGIEAATTTWVAFLDSDDEWLPDHLATMLDQADGHVLVCSAGTTNVGDVIGNPGPRARALSPRLVLETSELVVTSACLVSRAALLQAGLFRPLRRAQDLDMWLRVLEQGPGTALADRTILYHLHDEQASVNKDLMLSCFTDIVDHSAGKPWFDDVHGRDRAFARIHWDDLRHAQRDGRWKVAAGEARWLLRRPRSWPALATVLDIRRSRRRATGETGSTPQSRPGPRTAPDVAH